MAIFYLDTSVIVKRYRAEKGTEVIDQLLDAFLPDDRFYISFLSVLELTSAVTRLVNSGHIEKNDETQIYTLFYRDIDQKLQVWPLDNDIVFAAIPLVGQHNLRSADAIHLATAISISIMASATKTVMVSSDYELLEAADSSSLITLDPQDDDSLAELSRIRSP